MARVYDALVVVANHSRIGVLKITESPSPLQSAEQVLHLASASTAHLSRLA